MVQLTRESLLELVDAEGEGPVVSIYFPTVKKGHETEQNAIRCKNALNRAEDALKATGSDDDAIQSILSPGWELQKDSDFWEHQEHGLAVFAAAGSFEHLKLPVETDELVVVGRRPHVGPLIPAVDRLAEFYILAASPKRLRLLRATADAAEELDPAGLPDNLRDALNIDEYTSTLQQHSHSSEGVRGGQEGIYHGQGGSDLDVRKQDELLQYFRRIDDALEEYFGVERSPLVFAGVEYLFPIYQKANNYKNLLDECVPGNHDDDSALQLQQKAWEVVGPRLSTDHEKTLEQFGSAVAHDKGSHSLNEILVASLDGKVETLFVARGRHVWGAFDVDERSAASHDKPQPDSEDLLDRAAVQTLQAGGDVHYIDPQSMPNGADAAAIYRYA